MRTTNNKNISNHQLSHQILVPHLIKSWILHNPQFKILTETQSRRKREVANCPYMGILELWEADQEVEEGVVAFIAPQFIIISLSSILKHKKEPNLFLFYPIQRCLTQKPNLWGEKPEKTHYFNDQLFGEIYIIIKKVWILLKFVEAYIITYKFNWDAYKINWNACKLTEPSC